MSRTLPFAMSPSHRCCRRRGPSSACPGRCKDILAGALGFEPRLPAPKAGVLPLDDAPEKLSGARRGELLARDAEPSPVLGAGYAVGDQGLSPLSGLRRLLSLFSAGKQCEQRRTASGQRRHLRSLPFQLPLDCSKLRVAGKDN